MGKGKGGKKGASKKKEKEDAAAKKQEEEEAVEEDDTEFQKALLEIRVKELEQLKFGMQRKCEFLETQNELLKTQFEEMKEEKDDIIAHLRRRTSEGKTTVKELEDRLYGTQQMRDDEARDFSQRLAQKEGEKKEMNERMEKQILELNAKLATLEEFRLQREALLGEKQRLKTLLEDERKAFQREFNQLENKSILYKDRLRKDAIEMLVKMSKDVHKAGKLCLTATVKSALTSNIKLQNELETTSNDNIALRKKLGKLDNLLREKRMTIEVIEEENTVIHRKCLEHKEIAVALIDNQIRLERELETMKSFEVSLRRLQLIHGACRTDDEVAQFVAQEIDKIVEQQRQQDLKQKTLSQDEVHQLQNEVAKLRDNAVKLAITAKNLAQAVYPEDQEDLKNKLKYLLQCTYAMVLDTPNLQAQVKEQLRMPFPDVTPAIQISSV